MATLSFFLFFLLSHSAAASANRFSYGFPTAALLGSKKSQNSGGISSGVNYETKYFTQTLDHFDFQPQSYATFQQRYLIDDRRWGGPTRGAPIFVYTGNEGDVEWFANNTGFMFDVAPHFKALLVFIEHRYYGKSIPFGGKEAGYANATTLGYLSVAQTLADFATLILDLKNNLTAHHSPVVVFGGSYGGRMHAVLAAWFRLKYPHIAIGALASSAPILQFQDIISPYAFDDIITEDFRSESENCYHVIKNSWKELHEIVKQPGGAQKLAKSFNLCKGKEKESDLADELEGWIRYALVYAAMTDYPTASDFLISLPAYPVKKMCEAIDNPTTGNGTFARLYGAMNIYYNNSGSAKCFNLSWDGTGAVGGEAWSWQSCTEMILPTGANNEESLFPLSTYNYTDDALWCQKYYGVTPRPNWITTEFPARDIKRDLKRFGSNIIFFNGLQDPWSGGGVLQSLSKSLVAIVEPKGAHHVDLRFSTKEDPEWLQKVRKRETRIIARWLQQYYNDSRSS